MQIIASILLIAGGLWSIFYLRPKTKNHVLEIKSMQTKSISQLLNIFKQMEENGLGDNYREFVELKGKVKSDKLFETPFSNRQVVYCESNLSQVTENKEQYRDNNGNIRTKTTKHENTISNEKTSEEILLDDGSSDKYVVLEINATGCKLDIPKTFDRFEPKNNLGNYKYFNSFSMSRYNSNTLGFKMTEKTIEKNKNIYVIGEAFKVGNDIHIGKPNDNKKPFIVTTKSEEDLVNNSNQTAMFALIGGVIAIIAGICMFFIK